MKFCLSSILSILFISTVCYGQSSNNSILKTAYKAAFIENKGQIIDQNNSPNPEVLYLLPTPGFNVQLRRDGFSYDVYRISNTDQRMLKSEFSASRVSRLASRDSNSVISFNRIDFDLLNANPDQTIETADPSPDYRNYYTDGLPVMGIRNVRSYASILYRNIYPGTDLQFIRDEKSSFKYNFILHPGADPERIRLRIKGAAIVVEPSGSLRLTTELGIIEEKIPDCYYEIDGKKIPVLCSFKEVSDSVFGFVFDVTIPGSAGIVIDPTPTRAWGTYYGGVNDDYGLGVSVDQDLNVFLTGYTNSPDNIATSGAFQSDLEGGYDAFLVKFSPFGIRQWGTYYGGNSQVISAQCTVDKAGNIYIAGTAGSGANVATPGCFQFTFGGLTDVFLAKFSTNGYRIWGTYYGGEGFDGGQATNGKDTYCITDKNCNIFLSFQAGSDSLATPGTFMDQPYSLPDCILAEFDSSGQRKWATYFGGETTDDWPYSCAPDLFGHVYLSGYTQSLNNIATPGSHQEFLAGQDDCFLARFDTLGQLEWATYYGGSSYDDYGFCSAGANGEVYLCGSTTSFNNISTPGSHQENLSGIRDAFLVKFDSSGVRLWGTYYGGTSYDDALSVTVDKNGDILLTGNTTSTDSIATPGSYQTGLAGGTDAFLAKFTPGGQRLWGTYYGGSLEDQGWDVCTDQNTNIYVTGITKSTNNIASSDGAQNTYGGGQYDGFLVKFEDCPIPSDAGVISGPDTICVPQSGVIYSVPVISYATVYVWSVPPGSTIVSGAGTNTITVDFGPAAVNGKVSVIGTDTCGAGAASSINIFINPGNPVSITISASADTLCAGSPVIFTATPVNGGSSPSYLWKVNGGGVFPDAPTMTYNPANGDIVTCVLTSSNTVCVSNNPATSNSISMVVNPLNPVSVSISTSNNPYCQGSTVTFTAAPTNGGTTPSYLWKVNGIGVGGNSPNYSYIPANGDLVSCILNSNIVCPTGNPATSNTITMVENTMNPVSIVITTPITTVCIGTSVIFTAIPTNGGTTPAYQWKVNGLNSGPNNPQFTYTPVNGDCISCILTSNLICASGNPATSNSICMTVNPNLPVSISISTPVSTICAGTQVTFAASPTNQGTLPQYQWKVNGIGVGTSSLTYAYIPLNGDQVSCVLTSNAICPTGNPATSNTVTMTVNANMPVSVLISASANPVCSGITVTYTAVPTNGGTTPVYLWKVNGINAGINSNTYQYIPVNGDLITCTLTSNFTCTTGNPATSNTITMGVAVSPVVTFSLCNDTISTTNAKPFKLKGGIPLGGTYSGVGVAGGIFNPGTGVGNHQITYTYTNAALCSANAHSFLHVLNPSNLPCGSPLTDIRDNKVYPTIQIGSQCWMAANLNYGTMIPGNSSQRDNCIWEKYCFNDVAANCGQQTYYQWDELMQYDETVSTQGFCPPGWHVPTEADWNTLFSNYISNGFAGSPLKYSGFSGFNAVLSGARHLNKNWDYQGFATFFWSSGAHGTNKALAHGMNDIDPSVSLYPSSRSNAFSVRCIHD